MNMGLLKKIVIGIAAIFAIIIVLGIIGSSFNSNTSSNTQNTHSSSSQTTTQSQVTFTDSNFNIIESNPNQYTGSLADITGQIFITPQISANSMSFQMFQGGNSESTSVVVSFNGDLGGFQAKNNDCVRVQGSIAGQITGQNAFGATVTAISLTASQIEKIDCKDVLYPNVTVSLGNITKTDYISQFEIPKEGNVFLIVSLQIQNAQGKQLYTSPSSAVLVDSNRNQYDYDSATFSLQNSFESKNLLPGNLESGDIAFQVPENANITQFVYTLDTLNNVYVTIPLITTSS